MFQEPLPFPLLHAQDPTKEYYEKHSSEYFCATYNIDLQPLWEKLNRNLTMNASILDLGCGSGRDMRYFANKGFNITGIDYSFDLLRLAKDLSDQPLVLGDIRCLPFCDHRFGGVWAVSSLLHIPRQSISYVLSQIHRVLTINGILLTTIKEGVGDKFDRYGRYNVYYSKSEWTEILKDNYFNVIEVEKDIEIRETDTGGRKKITWIVCLAQAM